MKPIRIARALLVVVGLAWPGAGHASDVIISNWGTNLFGVPYAVAMEKGFFKEAGAPVTGAVGAGGGGSVVRGLLANELPYGEIGSSAAMDAERAGLPLIVIAGTARSFDNVWVTLPNSPLKGIKDLVGRRVSFTSPQSITEAFILMMLKQSGIDANSVTRIAAGGYAQGLTLLDSGGVDAAPVAEPLKTSKKGKYRDLFGAEEMLPPILSVVAATTRDYAKAHPEIIRAILAGRRKGVEYIYAHPTEAGQIMAKYYDMNPELAVSVVEAMTKTKQRAWDEGEIDIAELTSLQQGMMLTGAKVGDVDWQKLIDLSYLPADLQAKSRLKAN